MDGPEDITAVVSTMVQRGVRQEGEDTSLIVGNHGQRVRVTTERHVGREEELVTTARAAGVDQALPCLRMRSSARPSGAAWISPLSTGGSSGR